MNWLRNFKPTMVIWKENDVIFVQPVCANRVFRVRYRIAIRETGGDKVAMKLLRGSDER